ncbi:MAG: hypothetical protein OEU86_04060 [Gammaproteobacteria bacterium]|nr:hypothetical protein [Gammaproteobacteria bacterium]
MKHTIHAAEFSAEIAEIIAEIEACLPRRPAADREDDFQQQAFQERRHLAECLTSDLSGSTKNEWSLRSGDAHRLRQALKHSLTYFRKRNSNAKIN